MSDQQIDQRHVVVLVIDHLLLHDLILHVVGLDHWHVVVDVCQEQAPREDTRLGELNPQRLGHAGRVKMNVHLRADRIPLRVKRPEGA